MKEVDTRINFRAELVDELGEVHNISATKEITERYYSIKKLNRKVC